MAKKYENKTPLTPKEHRDEVAKKIIEQIEKGTAPWQKPWEAGRLGTYPFNPVTKTIHRGANNLILEASARQDPRWLTYRQAKELGASVKKGEKGTYIEFWKWTRSSIVKDENGEPVLDENGKKTYKETPTNDPMFRRYVVFNAEQIEGLEPYVAPKVDFDISEKAEEVITASNVKVNHGTQNRGYYRSDVDEVFLPPKSAFPTAHKYYATVLHELGHATGHKSRLKRQLGNIFGSKDYAKEELRAEMASYMIAKTLGVGHDPSNHAAYVKSWAKNLTDNKTEIFRAARDAEMIHDWILYPERRLELEAKAEKIEIARVRKEKGTFKANIFSPEHDALKAKAKEPKQEKKDMKRIYLNVPFNQKDEAKELGAKWNTQKKSWYIVEGKSDKELFAKWIDKAPEPKKIESQELRFVDFALDRIIRPHFETYNDNPADYEHQYKADEFSDFLEDIEKNPEPLKSLSLMIDKENLLEEFQELISSHSNNLVDFSSDNKLSKEQLEKIVYDFDYSNTSEENLATFITSEIIEPHFEKHYKTDYDKQGVLSSVKARKNLPQTIALVNSELLAFDLLDKVAELDVKFKTVTNRITPEDRQEVLSLNDLVSPEELKDITLFINDYVKLEKEAVEIKETKPMKRIYLNVPFNQKDEAKELGAKWNKQKKSWYIVEGKSDKELFAKWIDKAPEPKKIESQFSPLEEFANTLRSNGFEIKGSPIMDGKWHRVKSAEDKKKGKESAAYLGFIDGIPNGRYKNFKTGLDAKWVYQGQSISVEEKELMAKEFEAKKKERAIEQEESYKKAAKKAYGIFANLQDEATKENCEYLNKKEVGSYGVKTDKYGNMIIPVKDADGYLWGIQHVNLGIKTFLKGAKKQGCMHVIDKTAQNLKSIKSDNIIVAEGYATGASIYEATGKPVVIAFDSGNLKDVVTAVRNKHKQANIIIAADNDHSQEQSIHGNVGVKKAKEAAIGNDVKIAIPDFSDEEKEQGLTDFNDLCKKRGVEELKRQISKFLVKKLEKRKTQSQALELSVS
jgi:antirestriction protein ArdC/phage/plasmid primase-like uncharacterized protein/head-tail adaptor